MDLLNSFGNKTFETGQVFQGKPVKVKLLENTLKVSYHGANGTLRIYQSPNGKLWDFYEEFSITGNSYAQTGINGNYYYIEYTHGTGEAIITLATNTSNQIHSNFAVQLDSSDVVTVAGLNFNEDGELLVAGVGGGGVSSDVNVTNTSLDVVVTNQLDISSLATETTLGQVKSALEGTLSVDVTNQLDISGLALDSSLVDIKTELQKNKYSGDLLLTGQKPLIKTEPAVIVFDENIGSQIWGDSTVPWYNPEDGNEGWAYINEQVGGAQLYYYINTVLAPDATEPNIELGSISAGWYIGSQSLLTNADNRFILGVYTKPTGTGDAQPWYKSRKSYQLNSAFPLSKNVDYLFYWGIDPVNLHPELQHVELALASSLGPCASSEIVQFLSVNVPSNVAQYKFQGRVKRAGYVRNDVAREVVFANSLARDSQAVLKQMQFDTVVEGINIPGIPGPLLVKQAPGSNIVINQAVFKPDEITAESSLLVRDELLQRNIASLASTIGQGIYINMETEIPVSGGQRLFGDDSGNLYVRDLSVVSSVDLVKDELFATNGVLSDVVAGTQQFHVAVDALNNDSIGVYGYSPVLSMPEAIYTVDNSMKVYIDNVPAVNLQAEYSGNKVALLTDASQRLLVSSQVQGDITIANQIAGFSLEETQLEIKAKTDQLTFGDASALLVQGDFYLANQPVSFETPQDVNLYASDFKLTSTQTGVSQFSLDVNVNNLQAIPVTVEQMVYTGESELMVYDSDVFTELQTLNTKLVVCDTNNVEIPNGIDITNFPTSFQIENKQGTSIQITTSEPIDTNIYAIHNGTPVQVVAASSGHLLTNSVLETDANGALTSENVSGPTETYNALHSWIKNPSINVNARGYASTEGTFVPIAVDEDGKVATTLSGAVSVQNAVGQSLAVTGSVTSQLGTVDYGSLTSTLSGTGNSIHALDVQIKNASITAIQKSQPASVQQVITNEVINCTGPGDSRSLTAQIDTTGYLYVSFILNITNYSESGSANVNLYAQSSPDGVMWFNESSNGVYANGQVKIQIYSVLTVPYVRLYLDCSGVSPPNIKQFTIEKCFICQK